MIACTDILVGVEGAGLEWLYFMGKGKALLELAWPDQHWNFFYNCKCSHELALSFMRIPTN